MADCDDQVQGSLHLFFPAVYIFTGAPYLWQLLHCAINGGDSRTENASERGRGDMYANTCGLMQSEFKAFVGADWAPSEMATLSGTCMYGVNSVATHGRVVPKIAERQIMGRSERKGLEMPVSAGVYEFERGVRRSHFSGAPH